MFLLYLATVIDYAISIYILFIMVRIIGSWFPSFAHTKIMRFVAFYTDPYLNLFRRFIPPIGGVLDLSPILAFVGLEILRKLLLWIIFKLAAGSIC